MSITGSLCNQGRRQVGAAGLALRHQSLCLGLVPLVSEAVARGQQRHSRARESAAAGGEHGGEEGAVGRACR